MKILLKYFFSQFKQEFFATISHSHENNQWILLKSVFCLKFPIEKIEPYWKYYVILNRLFALNFKFIRKVKNNILKRGASVHCQIVALQYH